MNKRRLSPKIGLSFLCLLLLLVSAASLGASASQEGPLTVEVAFDKSTRQGEIQGRHAGGAGQWVSAAVSDSRGAIMFLDQRTTDAEGEYTFSFGLEEGRFGEYTVKVGGSGADTAVNASFAYSDSAEPEPSPSGGAEPSASPEPTPSPVSTAGSGPSATSAPTATPTPTATPVSTATPTPTTTPDRTFADLPAGHWAGQAVQFLAARQIVSGISESHFAPDRIATRAEFAAMIARSIGLTEGGAASFSDVPADAWYGKLVAAMEEAGIISGRTPDIFAPHDQVTRQEMAVILVKAYEYATGQSVTRTKTAVIADVRDIAPWALEAVKDSYELGLMKGYSDGSFQPNRSATRAEAAQTVYNLLLALEQAGWEAKS